MFLVYYIKNNIVNCWIMEYIPAHFAQSTESSILYHGRVKFDSPENSEDAFWCQAAKVRMPGILTWICIEVESLKVFPQAILFSFCSDFIFKVQNIFYHLKTCTWWRLVSISSLISKMKKDTGGIFCNFLIIGKWTKSR